MLKSYDELRKIDVTGYCEERDGIKYLNWAKCVDLLHKNGAETVYFIPIPNPSTGSSLIASDNVFTDKNGVTNRCYETRIRVVIDDMEFEMQSPVMNGVNPVKDNSMSQIRVWNSMCRSFVKGVAIHTGLGFDLWLKEEADPQNFSTPASEPQKKMIRELCEKHGIDVKLLYAANGIVEDEVTNIQIGNLLNAFKKKYGDE